jgi:hypothetical protein
MIELEKRLQKGLERDKKPVPEERTAQCIEMSRAQNAAVKSRKVMYR